MTTNAICNYDFSMAATDINEADVIVFMKDYCKKWVFQEELGDTGYLHYQGRVSLIKKRRETELGRISKENGLIFHWKPTSNNACNVEWTYVMKKDTRTRGPWKDDDEEKVLTRQLRQFMTHERYEWQDQVVGMAREIDDRSIKLIYDTYGDAGKSILAEFMEYSGLAYEIPPFRLMEDLMQCVMSVKTYPAYLVDMPRGMKKDKLGEFYAGLECIKNGVAYDKRYNFRKKRFDRPQLIVFTNVLPDFELLSKDRWEIWQMDSDRALRRYAVTVEPSFFISSGGTSGTSGTNSDEEECVF
jgi:hypothetical protein